MRHASVQPPPAGRGWIPPTKERRVTMTRASHARVTRMSRFVASLFAVAVLLGAGTAQAKDFCIEDPDSFGNPDLIAMNFSVPKPGKCRAFVGVYWPGFSFDRNALQGVACTPTSGTQVNFTITVGFAARLSNPVPDPGLMLFYTVALALPSLQGKLIQHNFTPDTATRLIGDAVGYECTAKIIL